MKKASVLFLAMAALAVTACSPAEEGEKEEEVVEVNYTLDVANSSLKWEVPNEHQGTVNISEGSLSMKGEELTSGSFKIDMTTIKSTDLEEPLAGVLAGHIMGTMPDENHPVDMFFNIPEFPTVGVTLGSYNDGKLGLTLDILGQELKQDVEVSLSADDKGASLKGDFKLDLSSLGMPGLQPDPETGEGIDPEVLFQLDVKLNK